MQVKSGRATGITGRILRTQETTGARTIGYAPGNGAWREVALQGITILRTPDELLAYLRGFG